MGFQKAKKLVQLLNLTSDVDELAMPRHTLYRLHFELGFRWEIKGSNIELPSFGE